MATTIVTARDITLAIATVNYDAQTTSAVLSNAPVITTYQTLDGKAYKHIDDQWTLNLELLADWGAVGSLFEAMWTAANTAPNTVLAVSLTTATGAVWAANVYPVFPSAGGTAPDAQTDSWAMLVSGTPVLTISYSIETGAQNETANHNRIHQWRVWYIDRAAARVGKVGE